MCPSERKLGPTRASLKLGTSRRSHSERSWRRRVRSGPQLGGEVVRSKIARRSGRRNRRVSEHGKGGQKPEYKLSHCPRATLRPCRRRCRTGSLHAVERVNRSGNFDPQDRWRSAGRRRLCVAPHHACAGARLVCASSARGRSKRIRSRRHSASRSRSARRQAGPIRCMSRRARLNWASS